MAFGKLVALAATAIVLVTLFTYQIEVPSIDPYPGSVAYAQPILNASFFNTGGSNDLNPTLPTAVTGATEQLDAHPVRYVAPAPVRKTLWQALFPTGTLTPVPPGGGTPPPPGSVTCTDKGSTSKTWSTTTYATVTITGPGQAPTTVKTPAVTSPTTLSSNTQSCSDGTLRTTWQIDGSANYELGTYYYHGWGDYSFDVSIFRVDGGSTPDAQVGLLQRTVTVSQGGLG